MAVKDVRSMHAAKRCSTAKSLRATAAEGLCSSGGSDPTHIWAAESRTDGVAPARSGSLGRVLFCASDWRMCFILR